MQERDLFGTLVVEFAASLPVRDHRIVVERFVNSQPAREIAGKLGVTEACAWSFLPRVSREFLDFLRRGGLHPG
jgi:DNA-directed RNA polymerase specialized sigma24 family protein